MKGAGCSNQVGAFSEPSYHGRHCKGLPRSAGHRGRGIGGKPTPIRRTTRGEGTGQPGPTATRTQPGAGCPGPRACRASQVQPEPLPGGHSVTGEAFRHRGCAEETPLDGARRSSEGAARHESHLPGGGRSTGGRLPRRGWRHQPRRRGGRTPPGKRTGAPSGAIAGTETPELSATSTRSCTLP